MTRDKIIHMAREAGLHLYVNELTEEPYALIAERFAALVAAAERKTIADWMRQHGFSTGQAYATATLLDRLGTEMVENTDAAVLEKREACARLCDEVGRRDSDTHAWDAAVAIRARSNP